MHPRHERTSACEWPTTGPAKPELGTANAGSGALRVAQRQFRATPRHETATQHSFFVNLQRLYWWVPVQAGYGDKRAS